MLLRSILFMPGSVEKVLKKAGDVNSDAVVFDLEDSVPLHGKEKARLQIKQTLDSLGDTKKRYYLRVNALPTGLLRDDCEAVLHPRLNGLMIPKVEDAEEIKEIEGIIDEIGAQKSLDTTDLKLHITFETAKGVNNAQQVLKASKKLEAVAFGAEDFTLDIGAKRTTEGWELFYTRAKLLVDAKAAGALAIDTVFSDLNDEEGLYADAKRANELGFDGKYLIHPRQIEVVNRVFTPTPEEIEFAKKVDAAFKEAQEKGEGAIAVDGKMVDPPVVEKARRLLSNVQEMDL